MAENVNHSPDTHVAKMNTKDTLDSNSNSVQEKISAITVGIRWGIWRTLPRLAQKQDGGRRVPVSGRLLTRHLATACVHSNHPPPSTE